MQHTTPSSFIARDWWPLSYIIPTPWLSWLPPAGGSTLMCCIHHCRSAAPPCNAAIRLEQARSIATQHPAAQAALAAAPAGGTARPPGTTTVPKTPPARCSRRLRPAPHLNTTLPLARHATHVQARAEPACRTKTHAQEAAPAPLLQAAVFPKHNRCDAASHAAPLGTRRWAAAAAAAA
jgi:hypothetical protein